VSARTPGHVLKLETVHFFRKFFVVLVKTISTMCTKIHDDRSNAALLNVPSYSHSTDSPLVIDGRQNNPKLRQRGPREFRGEQVR
jgi:hypothetical protein